jgi:GGDEF domain-containing protein
MTAAVKRRDRVGGSVAILLLGLDDFKDVVDRLGYRAADDLLCDEACRSAAAWKRSGVADSDFFISVNHSC